MWPKDELSVRSKRDAWNLKDRGRAWRHVQRIWVTGFSSFGRAMLICMSMWSLL